MAKILKVFDFDDTLTYTPTFANYMITDKDGIVFLGDSGDGDTSKSQMRLIKKIFHLIFSKQVYFQVQGDYIVVFDSNVKRPLPGEYLGIIEDKVQALLQDVPKQDFTQRLGVKLRQIKDFPDFFRSQQGVLVIGDIKGFHKNENTIGTKVNEELLPIYTSAENKMIVTGRDENLKKAIDMAMRWIQLDFPNYGLHCYPKGANNSIPVWKAQVIVDTVRDNGFDVVHFYEDKANWLKAVEIKMKEELPDVNFIGHHVTNIKNSRSI